jgi:AbiV family abortive infection protein
MKNAEFLACSKEELLVAAKASQRSAEGHFSVAKNAASIKQFGIANSLLILAVEECVKSAILTAGYFSINLPFDIEPYFKDHKTKHAQAAEIQPVINFIWKIKEAFTDTLENRKSAYGTVFKMALVQVFASIGIKLNNQPFENFEAWWKGANVQKNNGFYVGYFDGRWNFPTDNIEDAYLQTLSIVQPFVECLHIIQSLRMGDNLLFSKDKEFTQEEINASEIKLIPDEINDSNSQIDLSGYKPIDT